MARQEANKKDVFKSMLPIPDDNSKKILVLDLNIIPSEYEFGEGLKKGIQKYKEDFNLHDYIIIPIDSSKQNTINKTCCGVHIL